MLNTEEIKNALGTLERETNCNECVCINTCCLSACVFTETLNLINQYESRIKELEAVESAWLKGETI